MKKFALALGVAVASIAAVPASALGVDPNTGLTDFVFNFGGVGSSATFSGDDTLEITLGTRSTLDFHVEDCCSDFDEWDLVVNGGVVAWDAIQGGDGNANGAAAFGAPGDYFEAIAAITLDAGSHTFDLTQTVGVSGGSWLNISPARPSEVPLPAGGVLLIGAMAALGLARRKRSA
ncbi:hypothetical protein Ga0609869_001608 [Rhodovulum iodosum]|uniref:VPLPA-CTERM sorting domain-containing protein n=1 Tax=Rhodovulum iodosum TaxID=68291 RepID=A0ABV3XSE5_9RHOB|nr:VPLPA-CTERM sorting domain-containing protein [Rhodovulum robiginosum]